MKNDDAQDYMELLSPNFVQNLSKLPLPEKSPQLPPQNQTSTFPTLFR